MSLSQRSIRSSSYSIIGSGIQNIVQFIRSIILARILSPDDFGVYTFATSAVVLSKTLPIFGLNGALIHHAPESEGEDAYRVHFTLISIFTLFWGMSIAAISYILVSPENRWVVWFILATQMIDNIILTGQTILAKQVQFKRIAIINTITIILATLLALGMAWLGYGILSLLATDMVAALVPIIGYYVIRPVWKIRFGFNREVVLYFLSFGKRVFAGNLLQDILDRISDLWIWGYLGKTQLGFYSRANTFATYPRRVLSAPIADVSASTYAELKEQREKLSQAFARVNFFMIRVGFFFSGLLVLIAPEFIRIIIGVKWMPMLDAFRLMLIYTLLDPIKLTLSNLFIAIGKPEKTIHIRLVQLSVLVGSLYLFGFHWGITGVALAIDLMIVIGISLTFLYARQHVNFSLRQMFLTPTIALLVGMALARASLYLPGILGSPWRTGAIKTILFSLIYISIVFIIEKKYLIIYAEMLKHVFPRTP